MNVIRLVLLCKRREREPHRNNVVCGFICLQIKFDFIRRYLICLIEWILLTNVKHLNKILETLSVEDRNTNHELS